MKKARFFTSISNSFLFITLITIIMLSFSSFSAQADSEITTPEPAIGAAANLYLPVIRNLPISVVPPNPTPTGSPRTYYVSPSGNDAYSGTTEGSAWGTFNHAWKFLYPGDTLILLDGVYRQTLNPNVRNGQPGLPITIRAKNDGKAIIDGEHVRMPVKLGDTWPGPIGEYFVIEGIVAKNSSYMVYGIWGSHNILRRVSGYNANTDTNAHVFAISGYGKYNLIEDCVAAGTGRKMVVVHLGEFNTVRRCFADWRQWDGREWHDCWPWGDGIEIYNASNNIIENSIAYSMNPTYQISLLAQGSNNRSTGNKILGTMAIRSGMKADGTPVDWGTTRPQPTEYTCIRDFESWGGQRDGFNVYTAYAEIKDNLWQDIFAWGSAGVGVSWISSLGTYPTTGNNHINRATILNNGLDNPCGGWPCVLGGLHTDALQADLNHFTSITNSKIENIFVSWPTYPNGSRNLTSMNGEGARLTHRYIDGALTNQPLWPWPMEARIQNELGYSVTDMMTQIIFGTTNLNLIYP
jgi:hypothetical protein